MAHQKGRKYSRGEVFTELLRAIDGTHEEWCAAVIRAIHADFKWDRLDAVDVGDARMDFVAGRINAEQARAKLRNGRDNPRGARGQLRRQGGA